MSTGGKLQNKLKVGMLEIIKFQELLAHTVAQLIEQLHLMKLFGLKS